MQTYFDRFYKSQGLFWNINSNGFSVYTSDVNGPFCPNCKMDIVYPPDAFHLEIHPEYGEVRNLDESYKGQVSCSGCARKFVLSLSIEDTKKKVLIDYVLKKRAEIKVESLDEIPSQIKVRDEDTKYFLATKIGEKEGKRVGVVYFGEKSKEQSKKDYAQVFIDIDDEQVRFDKSNMAPKTILAKMTVEFSEAVHQEQYKMGKK